MMRLTFTALSIALLVGSWTILLMSVKSDESAYHSATRAAATFVTIIVFSLLAIAWRP